MSGLIGGAYGGCQIQLGVWVIGAEGDWEAINKEGQAFYVNGPGLSTIPLAAGGVWPCPPRLLLVGQGALACHRARPDRLRS